MSRNRGPYRAVVEDADDPMARGRLQVSSPDAGVSRTWAEACLPPVPTALLAMPAVGATVWVELEDGDRSRPVWTGVTWATAQVAAPRVIERVVTDRPLTRAARGVGSRRLHRRRPVPDPRRRDRHHDVVHAGDRHRRLTAHPISKNGGIRPTWLARLCLPDVTPR